MDETNFCQCFACRIERDEVKRMSAIFFPIFVEYYARFLEKKKRGVK